MTPRTWHGEKHQVFFQKWMPIYIRCQAERRLYKFWGPMFQDWFSQFPEEDILGLPIFNAEGDVPDAPTLTDEQRVALGKAISARKQKVENYFRNNRAKLDAGTTRRVKSEYALARSLFKAKPARKRLHKPVEIFQLRNNTLIREECLREGHDSINEESMANVVVDWVNEDDSVQVARIKAAQAARMHLRNRVVHALFAEASDEELQAIAEVMEREKAGELVTGDDADDGYPSWEVMKKVHSALEKMTGWFGFSMWGGPNPRIGGELSMKLLKVVSFNWDFKMFKELGAKVSTKFTTSSNSSARRVGRLIFTEPPAWHNDRRPMAELLFNSVVQWRLLDNLCLADFGSLAASEVIFSSHSTQGIQWLADSRRPTPLQRSVPLAFGLQRSNVPFRGELFEMNEKCDFHACTGARLITALGILCVVVLLIQLFSVSFGLSPAGVDFEASHADFEKAIEVPFQLFLRRCFPPEVRIARSLDALATDANNDASTDPSFRLPNEEEEKKKRPKRMTKSKKKKVVKAANASSTTTAMISFTSSFAVATPPQGNSSDTTPITNDDYDLPSVHMSPRGPDLGEPDFDGDIFAGMDDLLGSDDFGLDDVEARDMNMPPLPKERAEWSSNFDGVLALPLSAPFGRASTPATTASGGFNFQAMGPVAGSQAMEPLAASQARMNKLFADYRLHTENSPTRQREGSNLLSRNVFSPTPSSFASSTPQGAASLLNPMGGSSSFTPPLGGSSVPSVGSSPVPARFRRHDEGSDRIPPMIAPTLKALPVSTTPKVPALRVPILPQSRPSVNIPKPKPAPKPRQKPAAGASQAAAKMAAKVAGKKPAGRKNAAANAEAGEKSGDAASAADAGEEGVLADASNTLIYKLTNNSIKFDKEVKARQAAAAASKASIVPNRLYNPDGPTDLVIVPAPLPPPPRAPRADECGQHRRCASGEENTYSNAGGK
ncbi:hypothetical protein C8R43DRAFT_945233 [Mycena crocata]|nr:hypothetical protein C8R43DRAFT_945233 [Mycena crocata]